MSSPVHTTSEHTTPGRTTPPRSRFGTYVLLHSILFVYTLSGVCLKLAAGEDFGSLFFLLFYGLSLAILVIYAFFWQIVLKRLTLSAAFANKGVTVLWGFVWGTLLFAEQITPLMIIGALIVVAGIVLVVRSDVA